MIIPTLQRGKWRPRDQSCLPTVQRLGREEHRVLFFEGGDTFRFWGRDVRGLSNWEPSIYPASSRDLLGSQQTGPILSHANPLLCLSPASVYSWHECHCAAHLMLVLIHSSCVFMTPVSLCVQPGPLLLTARS